MLHAAIRFQPSRQWSCEMQEGCRLAAEKSARLLFPDTAERPVIPWNPTRSVAADMVHKDIPTLSCLIWSATVSRIKKNMDSKFEM